MTLPGTLSFQQADFYTGSLFWFTLLGMNKQPLGWADDFAVCSPKVKESRWNKNVWRQYGFILVSFRRWSMGPLLVQKPGTGEDYILLYMNRCNTTCYLHLKLKLCSCNKCKLWHSTFQSELWYQNFSLLWKVLPGCNFVGGFSGLLQLVKTHFNQSDYWNSLGESSLRRN